MADVPGKFYRATKVRTGVAPSSAGSIEGEVLPPVNPPGSSLNSVGLTMPSAFTVSNSPLTANGTIGVAGAGTVAQYIRGDGSLADFPESSGGGSSVSYYLNGSVDQGTIGGIAYKELSKVPILGAGTDFTINADGYIASFITDAGDPSLLEIPGGNWNFETYFSASSSGGTPTFYVELYKVSGTTATLIASSSSAPELIAFGTNLNPYFSTLAVPTTTLALTDRLAVRYYVTHSGRTITLHTENNHLCQIVTTFTTGITALNGLTAQVQNFAVGTTGTDFNIASATATHTFNLPTASATNRGALSSADWSLFTQAYNDKINSAAVTGTTTKTLTLTQQDGGTITASWSDLNTDAVLSVFGRTGAVVAANGDYTTAQVTESGNLYYTDARSRAALSFAAGSGAYNTSTGVITIPTNNNQITNGAGYITSAALAGYLPLVGGTMTGNINWGQTDRGLTWLFNTDGASIKFYNTGDGDTDSRLEFATLDNNNEYFRWVHIPDGGTLYESMRLVPNSSGNAQLLVSGSAGIGTNSITNGTTFGGGGQVNRLKVQSSNYTALEINSSTSGGSIQFTYGTNLPNQVSGYIGYNYANGAVNEFSINNVLSGPMVFATTSVEAMRIFAGRNVHIGPTPISDNGARLQVSGTSTFSNIITANSDIHQVSTGGLYWGAPSTYVIGVTGNTANGNLSFITGSTVKLTIASTGAATFSSNVTTTGGFLQFPNNYGVEGRNAANTAHRTVLKLNTSNQIEIGRDTDISSIILGTASAVNAMTITSSGNVGIGTPSPTNPLHIVSNTLSQLNIQALSGNTNAQINLEPSGTGIALIGPANNVDLAFRTNASPRMTIASAGSVTINNLAGSGNRIVVANSGGTLISAVIGSGLAFDGTTLTATGGGSGSISGSGTSGTVALFTGATSIGNSVITQSGSTVGVTSGITDSAVTFTNSTAYSTSNNYSLTYRSTTASFGIQPIANIVFDTVGDAASRIRFVTRANAPDYDTRMVITSNGTIGFNGNSGVGNAGLDKMSMGYLNSNYGWIQTWSGTPLLLNPSGNPVIIGSTANNGARLQVSGTATISGRATIGGSMFLGEVQSSYSLIETTSANGLWLRPGGISSPGGMFLTTSGNVGIGTPSPLTRLDCQIATTGTLTENAAFRDSSTNGNALQIWNGNNEARLRAVYYGTPSNQSITFWTIRDNGSQGERMRIDHIGNILFKGQSTTTNAEGIFQNLDSRLAFFASNTITVSKDISFFSSLINNEERLRLTSTGNILMAPWLAGNVLIRTSTDTGDTLRVNGNTFSNTIMTWNPENDNRSGVAWRLGAASIGAVTPNRRLRVNVGGVEYYIGAVEV